MISLPVVQSTIGLEHIGRSSTGESKVNPCWQQAITYLSVCSYYERLNVRPQKACSARRKVRVIGFQFDLREPLNSARPIIGSLIPRKKHKRAVSTTPNMAARGNIKLQNISVIVPSPKLIRISSSPSKSISQTENLVSLRRT